MSIETILSVFASIIMWSLICAVDGCLIFSSTICTTKKVSPLRWSMYVALGHFLFAMLGLVLSAGAAYVAFAFAYAVSLFVLGYLFVMLFRQLKHAHVHDHHCHHAVGEKPLMLLAISASGDAVLQGSAMVGQIVSVNWTELVILSTVSVFFIASLVGVWTYGACIGYRSLQNLFGGENKRLIYFGLLAVAVSFALILWKLAEGLSLMV